MDICEKCGNNLAMFNGTHHSTCEDYVPDEEEYDYEEMARSPVVAFITSVAERSTLSVNQYIDRLVEEKLEDGSPKAVMTIDDLSMIVEISILSGINTTIQTLMEQDILDPDAWIDYFDASTDPDTFEW